MYVIVYFLKPLSYLLNNKDTGKHFNTDINQYSWLYFLLLISIHYL